MPAAFPTPARAAEAAAGQRPAFADVIEAARADLEHSYDVGAAHRRALHRQLSIAPDRLPSSRAIAANLAVTMPARGT